MNRKYVFVSGAAGGIGKATVQLLASKGYYVFAADINQKELDELSSAKIIPIQLDITDLGSINYAVGQIKSFSTYLNGIVNVAGKFDQFPLVEVAPLSFVNLINVNLIGHQQITRALFPLLFEAKGRVVNLSSETVLAQMPLQSYGFSKKLFDVWNTQLRMELDLFDMRTIIIRAGGHQTQFIAKSSEIIGKINTQSKYSELMKQIKKKSEKLLNKSFADPEDLAKIIFKVLSIENPNKVYDVNVSLLFKFLSILPSGLRELLINHQIKKWMQ